MSFAWQISIIQGDCEWQLRLTSQCELDLGVRHTAWWRRQMETFSALLAICVGNSTVTGEFPAKRPVTQSFDVFFDNNGDASDLRRHRAHYDVTVMV